MYATTTKKRAGDLTRCDQIFLPQECITRFVMSTFIYHRRVYIYYINQRQVLVLDIDDLIDVVR